MMAELALSAAAAAGASAAAAGTTAFTTAAAGTAFLAPLVTTVTPAVSGVLGTLSTVATVGSMAASILGGVATYNQSMGQAAIADLNAEGARIEAQEKSLRIRRELAQKTGQARVAFAGSGLDISSASAIESGYRSEADFEIGLARTGGEIGAAGQRMQAAAYRTRGFSGLVDAAAKAGGAYVNNSISIARRG